MEATVYSSRFQKLLILSSFVVLLFDILCSLMPMNGTGKPEWKPPRFFRIRKKPSLIFYR